MSWWHDRAGSIPLLTPAQEIYYGQQVRAWLDDPDPSPVVARRGKRARDRFVQANLRLVINVAERYRSVPAQYADDLIQAGNMGLIRAVERFDPARGYKFSTYAYWWIRQGINSFLEHHSRTVRLPTTHAAQYTQLQSAILSLRERLNRPPTRDEIATEMGWTVETVERVSSRPSATVSLDAPNMSRDNGGTVAEAIAAPGPDLMDLVASADQMDRLVGSLRLLSPMAARIMTDQFLTPVPTPQHQLARELGIGRDQLRTIIAQSLNQLRLILRSGMLPPPAPPEPIACGDQLGLPIETETRFTSLAEHAARCRRRKVASMGQMRQCALALV